MTMTAFTGLAFTSFTNQHEQGPSKAFQATWWFWLAMTGLGLGATASIKWVGFFTIAWVGSLTILQLWILLGDVKTVTPVSCLFHLARMLLIGIALVCQASRCQNLLPHCNSYLILHGHVWNPFPLSRQSRRW
jgi:dolichyl-phosphate-mannose-protein mannosyltransferase